MSLAMKTAQVGAMGDFDARTFQGDPGIFGTLKGLASKAIGVGVGLLPGPVGLVARAGLKKFRGRDDIQVALPGVGKPSRFAQRIAGERAARVAAGRPAIVGRSFGGGVSQDESLELEIPGFKFKGRRFNGGPGGQDGTVVGTMGQPVPLCAPGFRPNKSGYYRRSPAGGVVFIQPQSVCVKSRRIDAGNTRATKRAIARIRAAKRLKDALSGVTIRKTC